MLWIKLNGLLDLFLSIRFLSLSEIISVVPQFLTATVETHKQQSPLNITCHWIVRVSVKGLISQPCLQSRTVVENMKTMDIKVPRILETPQNSVIWIVVL